MRRVVKPELLDILPSSDAQAAHSRADLRRLNGIMGHARILTNAFYRHMDFDIARRRSLQICELGAGDGCLLLKMARDWSTLDVTAEAEIIDRHYLVEEETQHAFIALNWSLTPVVMDVMTWLNQSERRVDVMFANLFLHHFQDTQLREMLRLAAAQTNLFIACDPRRSAFALAMAHMVGVVGCNAVTRHDAVTSVRAGFTDHELSSLWPATGAWQLSEEPAGLFSHCFIANRYG